MNHKQSKADSDLQKAIDDITKTTSVDPTFSDPIAAPSTLPDGADFGPIEPVGPFPAPEPIMPPMKAPVMPEMGDIVMPADFAMPTPNFTAPMSDTSDNRDVDTNNANVEANNIQHIKDSALRDLLPLLEKMDINPSQKFNICRDAFESLHDYSILEYAYKAAKRIVSDTERGEALLYIVKTIGTIN